MSLEYALFENHLTSDPEDYLEHIRKEIAPTGNY